MINSINSFLKDSRHFYTISIDMNSVYSYVSANYDSNFSFTDKTLLGKHFSVTLHPDDVAVCAAAGQRCFARPGKLIPVTLRKHDGRGGFVTTKWEMQAIFDEAGNPKGVYCMGYNISELVYVKDELGQAKTQLEEIGFIQSHVVRKPLANILALAEMVKDGNQEELLPMLIESARELDEVVKDIAGRVNG